MFRCVNGFKVQNRRKNNTSANRTKCPFRLAYEVIGNKIHVAIALVRNETGYELTQHNHKKCIFNKNYTPKEMRIIKSSIDDFQDNGTSQNVRNNMKC